MDVNGQADQTHRETAGLAADRMKAIVDRNNLIPIGRIPDDALLTIFAQLVASRNLLFDDDWAQRNQDAIAVSHVCQRWRLVATHFPALWNVILIGSRERAVAFFARARSSGVSVAVQSGTLCTDGTAAFLDAYMDRIERLELYDTRWGRAPIPPRDRTLWMEKWTSPAPALQYLKLHFVTAVSISEAEGVPMFNGTTPVLRSLDLSGVRYSPASPLFQNLVQLKIDGHGQVYSSKALLDIMKRCPGLERVQLEHIQGADNGDIDVPGMSIALPHLSELVISPASQLLRQVLPHLTLPLTAKVRAVSVKVDDEFPPLVESLPVLSAARHVAQVIYPTCADNSEWAYAVSCDPCDPPRHRSNSDDRALQTLSHAQTLLHLRYAPVPGPAQAIPPSGDLRAVCDPSALTSHTLFDYYGFFDSEERWRAQLRDAACLAVLRVFGVSMWEYPRGRDAHPVARGCEGIVALVGALTRDPTLCPALARLEFDGPSDGVGGRALARALKELASSRTGIVALQVPSPLLDVAGSDGPPW